MAKKTEANTARMREASSGRAAGGRRIVDAELRENVISAWVLSLAGDSGFRSIREIPPAGNPGVLVLKRGDQTDHIRGVTRLAMKMADEFTASYPDIPINRDIVIAGGICHDIGKAWEFDPVRRQKWLRNPERPGVRRSAILPTASTSVCPQDYRRRLRISPALTQAKASFSCAAENTIIHFADHAFWYVLLAGDLVIPDTVPMKDRRA